MFQRNVTLVLVFKKQNKNLVLKEHNNRKKISAASIPIHYILNSIPYFVRKNVDKLPET